MQIIDTAIADVKVIIPKKFGDRRGFFSETYNARALAALGMDYHFVQDNQSFSQEAFTLRGLHYQKKPLGQTKFVRVLKGAALDIVVDIRRGSPTYGQHVTVQLSEELWNFILVPEGFAHGVLTLQPNTELFYKVTNYYSPENDRGIRWDDPDLKIALPVSPERLILSDKDKVQPLLRDADNNFVYGQR